MKEEKITKQDLKNEAVEDGLKGSSGFKAVGITFPDQPIWEEQYSKLSDEKKILLETQEQTKLTIRILSETKEQTKLTQKISNNIQFFLWLTIIGFALSFILSIMMAS